MNASDKRLDLAEFQALADAATEGPWSAATHLGDDFDGLVWPERMGDPIGSINEPEDAAFIAAARTAVPQLLAEVQRWRAIAAALADRLRPHVVCLPHCADRAALVAYTEAAGGDTT